MTPFYIDLETENHTYFGALASPRHPKNFVVACGWAVGNGPVQHTCHTQRESFLKIPDECDILVAHNAPFEMDWFLVQEREEIMRFLARGGRVFCTAYAEYLITNQQETYPSLDETAPKYGGTHKVDGIKILWQQGVLTSEIDKALLLDYLCGPNGDIENTRKCFLGQAAILQARGMWNMALARMEGMLYNTFAMDAGLFVHKETAHAQLAEQSNRLVELQHEFARFRQHIPAYVEFKDTSDYHMSAWLFGGPIRYRIQDVWYNEDGTPKHEKADFFKFADGTLVLCEEAQAHAELYVNKHGPVEKAKAGKNKGQPRVFREDTSTPKLKWYDRLFECPALIPLGSFPQEIQKMFKEEFSGKRKLADESPVYSTGSDCIEMLSKRSELSDEVRALMTYLLEYAKVDKDVGTYYLREECDEAGNVVKQSGMLQYLTPESIVYHVLNCTSTVTGRLSSNRPNMQNIPRGDTSNVKKMFTSRFGDDGYVIEADYSALEVVTLAAFSNDKNLVKALLEGIDMHCMRLSQQLGESYEEVLQKCKDDSHPDHKRYKTMRTDIKPKAFAYQYGATAHGIAFATGCSVEEAQAFIDAEKALFPDVESYYEDVIFRTVETNTTMHREQNPETQAWSVYKRGVWQSPAGTCYEFRQYPKTKFVNGQRVSLMEFKPTQMRNYPIQGESGFFVQVIAGIVARWFISKNFFAGKAFIINQVHDALYFDVHKDVLAEVCRTVKYIMESLPTVMQSYGYSLQVPFPAEVEYGPSMFTKEKFKDE